MRSCSARHSFTDRAVAETFRVEIVFATPELQELIGIDVQPGTTVQQAIDRSAIWERFDGVDLGELPVGIWGREVGRDHELRAGDRVEIYRALQMEPREARRLQSKG